MDREELIVKWLNHNLSPEEQKAFEALGDYEKLITLDSNLKNFKSPEFSIQENYDAIEPKISNLNSTSKNNWLKIAVGFAATIILAVCINYFINTDSNLIISTEIAEQNLTTLLDASEVQLNANSELAYNIDSWDNERVVNLDGEAFFKVAKGQTFTVVTEAGTVKVLGTQFNVKQRDNFFEVTCFEGIVEVNHNNETQKLYRNNTVRLIDGKLIAIEKEITNQPYWLKGESYFKNVTLENVLVDLQNQYDIKIEVINIDTSRVFTGSFTHKNLDLALQSITIPLHLKYHKTGKTIILERE